METIIDLMRSRLLDNPADETLVQLRIELNDVSDWLKSLARMPVEVRAVAISFPSTLKNEEEENPYILHGEELEKLENQFRSGLK